MTQPANARQRAGGGRAYVWRNPAGVVETFPSVSTILGRVLAKPALPRWAAGVAAEYVADNLRFLWKVNESQGRQGVVDLVRQAPWAVRDRAADRGTLVHALTESIGLGRPVSVPDEAVGYLEGFHQWMADFSPRFVATETTVYSREPRYAGTLDLIVDIEGLGRVLVDYKTGKDVYPEAALQLHAYRAAQFVGLPDGSEEPVPKVRGCYVLRLYPGGYDFCRMAADLHTAWEAVLTLYEWSCRDDLIGPAEGPRAGRLSV